MQKHVDRKEKESRALKSRMHRFVRAAKKLTAQHFERNGRNLFANVDTQFPYPDVKNHKLAYKTTVGETLKHVS